MCLVVTGCDSILLVGTHCHSLSLVVTYFYLLSLVVICCQSLSLVVCFSVTHVDILTTTHRSVTHLMTLEALHIKAIKPCLNTKDEYRSRVLPSFEKNQKKKITKKIKIHKNNYEKKSLKKSTKNQKITNKIEKNKKSCTQFSKYFTSRVLTIKF